MNFASHRQFGEGYLLTTKTLEWFRKQYLPAGIAPTDPAVSPLYGPKLAALKAAFVVTAGYDPLRDDGLAFVERLCAQGTSVQHLCYEGTFHGFVTMGGVLPVASDAVREIASWMGEALGVVPTK
jgi:acetyl esterase